MEQINLLIEKEIDVRVQDALTRYARFISDTHQISLVLLLRDIPLIHPMNPSVTQSGAPQGLLPPQSCLGVTAKGTRCTSSGKFGGYCSRHQNQSKKIQPIRVSQEGPMHNHGVPPLFQEGCPACQACFPCEAPKKKSLIDFTGVL